MESNESSPSYSYTPYTRWYLLKRKRARLAAQQNNGGGTTPPPSNAGTFGAPVALYLNSF